LKNREYWVWGRAVIAKELLREYPTEIYVIDWDNGPNLDIFLRIKNEVVIVFAGGRPAISL
jgi:hypothetical protein